MPDKLYLDIETAPYCEEFAKLPELGQRAFMKKFKTNKLVIDFYEKHPGRLDFADQAELDNIWQKVWDENASLHAEFSKIICIAVGMVIKPASNGPAHDPSIAVKGWHGPEQWIIEQALLSIKKFDTDGNTFLMAHNGIEFDFPYMARRIKALGIEMPEILKSLFRKQWNENYMFEDTAQYWKFGQYKNYASLITLCWTLGVPSSKDELDGTKVAGAWFAGKIKDICNYCMDDVVSLINVDRRLRNLPIIDIVKKYEIKYEEPKKEEPKA